MIVNYHLIVFLTPVQQVTVFLIQLLNVYQIIVEAVVSKTVFVPRCSCRGRQCDSLLRLVESEQQKVLSHLDMHLSMAMVKSQLLSRSSLSSTIIHAVTRALTYSCTYSLTHSYTHSRT